MIADENSHKSDGSLLSRPISVVLEENIRLRQAINDVVLTNHRWLRYNREQAIYVKLALEKLRRSEEENERLSHELEAMKIQVQIYKSRMEAGRKERIEEDQHKENARFLIRQLQEENWLLRSKFSEGLIYRGPSSSLGRFPN